MSKNYDYNEPELKVVTTKNEDILTASQGGGGDEPSQFDPENPGGFVTPIIG